MSDVETINILNLIEELDETLVHYFSESNVSLVEKDSDQKVSFIIVDSEEKHSNAFNDFNASINNINFIYIGDVQNTKDFLKKNGKLILGEKEQNPMMLKKVLDNFFKKSQTIHVAQDFNEIENIKSLKITNHLTCGYYIDEITLDSFEKGFNIVALRSFLDHSIFYISYLKQSKLAGIPIEIDYGILEEHFIVNIHVSVNNFVTRYIIDSFGQANTQNPMHYLMSIIKGTSEFLELCLIEESNKLVIRGMWGIAGNNIEGFSFNLIEQADNNREEVEQKVDDYKQVNEVESELEEKAGSLEEKELPGGVEKIIDASDEQSEIITVSGSIEEDEHVQIVSGSIEEDEHVETVFGNFDEQDQNTLVKGEKEKPDDFKTVVSGGESEKEVNIHISSSESGEDTEFRNRISSSEDSEDESDENLSNYDKESLINKVKNVKKQNKNLKNKIKGLMLQVNSLKETEKDFKLAKDKIEKTIEEKIKKIQDQMAESSHIESSEKERLIENLEQGSINEVDSEKLAHAIRREAELIEKAKEAHHVIKKLNIEVEQKESLFKSEINKAKKAAKAKDLVVEKAKESIKRIIEKSANQKKILNNQISDLKKKIELDPSKALQEKIQKMKTENEFLKSDKDKLVAKLQTFEKSKNASEAKEVSNTSNSNEEEKFRIQITNITNKLNKEKEFIQKQLEESKEREEKLKEKLSIIAVKLKEFEAKISMLETDKKAALDKVSAIEKGGLDQIKAELLSKKEESETLQGKLREVAIKLKESETKLAAASKNSSSAKEKKLEKDIGRLRIEYAKSQKTATEQRKELLKIKGENTALKNKLKKLEKSKKSA